MTALLATEWLKLRTTRSIQVLVVAGIGLGLLRVAAVLHGAGSAGGVRPGTREAWTDLIGAALSGSLVVMVIGALCITSELRHGSITPTLLLTSRRHRVVLAKLVSSAVVGVVVTAASVPLSAVTGVAAGVLRGMPGVEAAGMVLGAAVAAAFLGCIGVAIGLLVGNQVAAVVLPLAWVLVVENLLPGFGLDAVLTWLPGHAAAALSLAGLHQTGYLPPWLAFPVLIAYTAALSVPAVRRFAAADIT